MKILWASLGIVALAALSLASCVLYDIHHEVDRTPIVEIPFDPSQKDVIKLENFKMPRSGRFHLAFFVSRKDRKDMSSNDMDYLIDKDNIFNINFQASHNGEEFKNGEKTWNGNIKPFFYQSRDGKAILRIKYQKEFRKNDVLDIFIENQYPTDKFKDFDVVFKINEVKPESK